MNRLIGKQVDIHLTCDEIVSGILFDSDDDNIYVHSDIETVIAVPRGNVKYYVGNTQNTAQTAVPKQTASQSVKVYIDDTLVGDVPMPESVSIASCNENVLQIIYENEDVKEALKNKVQLSIEYDIGNAVIHTTEGVVKNPMEEKIIQNSFGMGANSMPATPLDMIKAISGGKRK